MKKQLKGILAAVAPIVCLAMWGGSAKAASLQIYAQEDGGSIDLIASSAGFGTATFIGNYHDFHITLLAGSADNGASLSDLLSSQLFVANTDASAHHVLGVLVTEDGYSLPLGAKLFMESGMGGSVNTGTLDTNNIFQAYFDKNNNLDGTTDQTNGPQNASLNGSTFDTGSAKNIMNRTGDYSLTSKTRLDLSIGGSVNYSEHINVTPVPLPSVAWAGMGLMGALFVARRRAQA